ncbi:MAG: hypothetical protein RL404_587 [Pseudomonadota bacterium]
MSLFSRQTVSLLSFVAALAGCATESELAAIRLDQNDPKYATDECQRSIAASAVNTDMKNASMVASPALVLLSGGLLLPVIAANAAMDYSDHVDASNLSVNCGGKGKSRSEIAGSVSSRAVIGAASTVIPIPKP